jgi:signal recognition particle GTPase
VKFVGLGETPEDIETFDPQRFVDALFGTGDAAPR